MRRRTLLGVVLALGLTACVEDLGGAFLVVNEWDQPLFHVKKRIRPGDTYKYGIQGCGQPGLVLRDKNGDVVVRLEEWCAGQRLTVRGPDDFTLESATAQ